MKEYHSYKTLSFGRSSNEPAVNFVNLFLIISLGIESGFDQKLFTTIQKLFSINTYINLLWMENFSKAE